MKNYKNNLYFTIALAVFLTAISIIASIHIFIQYSQTIINKQQEQMITIARSVSDTIKMYVTGYEQDLKSLVDIYNAQQNVSELLVAYAQRQNPNVKDILICDQDGNITFQALENTPYTALKSLDSRSSAQSIEIYKDHTNRYYITLSMNAHDGYILKLVLNIQIMYERLIDNIKLGKHGYVMIKDSDGIILMHTVKEQIGAHVITDRRMEYPNYDFSQLEKLIENQKKGIEGVEIYNSYWWADNPPSMVKKISAYTPVYLGDDFLIVSAVMDYDEIAAPIASGVIKLLLVAFVMILGVGVLLSIAIRSLRMHKQYRKENKYLREYNQALEELHKKEEEIFHHQRLQLIGTMTSGIAHEFNNLLTPIMAHSCMLLQEVPKDSEIYDDIHEIYLSSEKAKEIIKQISMVGKKNEHVNLHMIAIDDVVKSCLKMVRSVKGKQVQLIEQIDCKGKQIMGNETQLNQVILNLCTNALYAIGEDEGTITVGCNIADKDSIPQKHTAGKSHSEYLLITVADTGCGMDEAIKNQIFDPFFTTKGAGKGTGLGLSIVQSIVNNHNGTVIVESKAKQGSKFTVIIPTCGHMQG